MLFCFSVLCSYMSLSAEADIDENRHIIMMNFSLVSDAAIKNVVIEMSYNFVFF